MSCHRGAKLALVGSRLTVCRMIHVKGFSWKLFCDSDRHVLSCFRCSWNSFVAVTDNFSRKLLRRFTWAVPYKRIKKVKTLLNISDLRKSPKKCEKIAWFSLFTCYTLLSTVHLPPPVSTARDLICRATLSISFEHFRTKLETSLNARKREDTFLGHLRVSCRLLKIAQLFLY